MSDVKMVYEAIRKVQEELAKEGIGKDKENKQQGFKFRGIDDVYAALSPLLAKHCLVILPRTMSRECTERASKSGGSLFTTTIPMEFDLVCSTDGSKHTIATIGEGMDSADKGSNKAMSSAYKYAAFMAFCIPVEGMVDADAESHEVKGKEKKETPKPFSSEQFKTLSRKVWSLANIAGVTQEEIKHYGESVLGKSSSKDWTEGDFNAAILYLDHIIAMKEEGK